MIALDYQSIKRRQGAKKGTSQIQQSQNCATLRPVCLKSAVNSSQWPIRDDQLLNYSKTTSILRNLSCVKTVNQIWELFWLVEWEKSRTSKTQRLSDQILWFFDRELPFPNRKIIDFVWFWAYTYMVKRSTDQERLFLLK